MECQSKDESSEALRLKAGATPDPLWCSLKDNFDRENEMPPVDMKVGGKQSELKGLLVQTRVPCYIHREVGQSSWPHNRSVFMKDDDLAPTPTGEWPL